MCAVREPAWLVALATRKGLRSDGREQRLWGKSSLLPHDTPQFPPLGLMLFLLRPG